MSAPFAQADDGYAALAMGGIVFTKSTAVRMASEDLYVSPKQVRVRFAFANDTDKDIEALVAFALPDIDIGRYWVEALGTTSDDPVNFVGFRTSLDGRPLKFEVEQRAITVRDKRDVTALLKRSGLPVNMIASPGRWREHERLLKSLPALTLKDLVGAGAIDPNWSACRAIPIGSCAPGSIGPSASRHTER